MFVFIKAGISQNTYEYTYDNSGNRLTRQIIYLKSAQTNDKSEKVEKTATVLGNNTFVSIYPNPTSGMLKLNIGEHFRDQSGSYVLMNSTGTIIESKHNLNVLETIDLSALPQGIYILRLTVDDETAEWKIVKE